MGQLLIRNVDDRDLDRLRARAREQRTSLEAIGREAIRKEARLTVDEKVALVKRMLEAGERAKIPGVAQTPGWVLIREDRDFDH